MLVPDPVLAEVTRSGWVESVHRGRAVGVEPGGAVTTATGAVDEPVLLRSCAKPLQAWALLRVGLRPDGAALAVACASHDGTELHRSTVLGLLASAGLDERALANTPALALDPTAAAEQQLGPGPSALHQNCSGKHAAMLATCVARGWPLDGYLERDHPVQVAVLEGVEELAGEAAAHVAVDGCGAPIAAISLTALARAFSRLAIEEGGAVAAAMRARPDLVGGERRDVTRLMRAVPGLVAKDGAEGAFVAALPDGRAAAVKVADGSMRACVPALVATLRRLGLDDGGALDELAEPPILGHGRPVGTVRVVAAG